ncbi:hypothetical protein IVB22_01450 [Bradyrhizobium sp. 190]|uniref:hypothetical protein n=1 Tax=Bradyrhizobium sp. 190 TaxID=2782658 RepID=UPI001FF93D89|nr:hypothetical protein [Bradyrhizobium sp. 190]MCK1511256.1 hypothetical protein [Bradyrhizobium sp. 190]
MPPILRSDLLKQPVVIADAGIFRLAVGVVHLTIDCGFAWNRLIEIPAPAAGTMLQCRWIDSRTGIGTMSLRI